MYRLIFLSLLGLLGSLALAQGQVPSQVGKRLGAGQSLHIVIYGTSLSAGGEWVSQLKKALDAQFPGKVKVTNSAKGGMYSDWGMQNLASHVIALKPDVVFLEFAVNDAVARFHCPIDKAKRNLESMIDRIRSSNPRAEVILQVTNPVIDRPPGTDGSRPQLADYFKMVRAVAAEKRTVLIDHEAAWTKILDQGPDAYHKLVPDGLHPNGQGYAQVATPAILSALGVKESATVQATLSKIDPRNIDVLVYGGTSAAVMAAVQARQMGKNVVILNPDKMLGGMTSGGLGWTDLGNAKTIGGLSREFYHRIWQFYQEPGAWKFGQSDNFSGEMQGTKVMDNEAQTMWVFEPHVAQRIFDRLVEENDIPVVSGRLDLKSGVAKRGSRIAAIRTEDGRIFPARMFIDATYEGDLMAKAGVHYTVGREPRSLYHEALNGIQAAQAKKNQLPAGISPYVTKGQPASGLLPGVNPNAGGPDGAGDQKIQAYCYRMCLTAVPENRVPIEKPAGYDERNYEILFRAIEAGQDKSFFKFDMLPNRKTDSNNASGISCDYIGMNYAYPEADYATREKIAAAHELWQRGMLWALQNSPRIPPELREKYAKWGLPKDEFVNHGNWSPQIYVREARRMVSDLVITENNLRAKSRLPRPIGMGSYQMDSHNVQRMVSRKGTLMNEGDVQDAVGGPYQIDYGCIIPRQNECENLLVPVCVSATHIAYGSIRMEPVFMILGQSAATAASLALDQNVPVQKVDYSKLRSKLLEDGQVLALP